MTTLNLNSANNNQTFNLGSTSLNPETVNVTTSTAVVPTVNINATLVSGAFSVNATAGATANLDEVVGALGSFELDADGGTIIANAAIGVAVSNDVTIKGGGTFVAGASFLGLLNNTLINFGTDNTSTDTLIIDNNGGLLNLSFTSPIGGFTGVHEVINNKLISGADVAEYSISQVAVGSTQTLTFENNAGQSLGSFTFTAGTFSAAQLGLHARGSGPLNLVTAADGSLTTSIACYLAGTHILTTKGEVAVENLRIGDLVVTASGATRPIKWLGHRRIDITRHPEPENVRPIRIVANAFGDSPRRDLWLSPEHCVAIEDALIPINVLVNGTSVTQVEMDSVEYWHVELDQHDVVLAEGLPAESYLDTGNRLSFVNGGAFIEAHPDFRPRVWTETCLPMAFGGDLVARVKANLRDQLPKLGVTLTEDADAHILVDGVRIEPIRLSPWRVGFALPQNGQEIVLRSKLFTPAHVIEGASDTRKLGLCIARLQFDGVDWPLDSDEACADGWQAAEMADGRVSHRWTSGSVSLFPGTRFVLVDFGGFGAYWNISCAEVAKLRAA